MYYKKEKTFDDLRSPITNHKLRFDFYIPDLNLIIEYDGKQHFRKGTTGIFTEERYKQIHLYDKVKNDYCESHNINLLRIPYTLDSKKKIYRKLNKYLMNHVCIWFTHNY
jgi:very-short-patch-repair endonuclease